MAAALASKCSSVGCSLLGWLGNMSVLLSTSNEMMGSNFWSQQQRTFIQMRTVPKVVDNSGAKEGNVHTISQREERSKVRRHYSCISKGSHAQWKSEEKKACVCCGCAAAMQHGRCDGSEVKFDDKTVVLVDKQGQPIGTRVFRPVPHKLRKKHVKILSLAEHIA